MQLMGTVSNTLLNAAPGWIQYVWIIQRWKLTFWNFSFESLGCGILFFSKQWLSCLLWQGLEQGLVAIRSKQAETAEAGECLLGLWLFKNCKLTYGTWGTSSGKSGAGAGSRREADRRHLLPSQETEANWGARKDPSLGASFSSLLLWVNGGPLLRLKARLQPG